MAAVAIAPVSTLITYAEELIDGRQAQPTETARLRRVSVRELQDLTYARCGARGDPGRAGRALRWAYALRGEGSIEAVLAHPACEREYRELAAALERAHAAEVPPHPQEQRDPPEWAVLASGVLSALRATQAAADRAAEERVRAVAERSARELDRLRELHELALDAEIAATTRADDAEQRATLVADTLRTLRLHVERLETDLAAERAQGERLRGDLERQRADARQVNDERASAHARVEVLAAEAERLTRQVDAATRAAALAEQGRRAAEQRHVAMQTELANARGRLGELRRQAEVPQRART